VLRRHDLALTKVERPRRTLESLFLEIVSQARAEGVQTSGASSGGEVAEFLGGAGSAEEAVAAAPEGDAGNVVDAGLLDSLVKR
jgi:hypothetical protein